MTPASWLAFAGIVLMVSLTPGPGVVLTTGAALRGGYRLAWRGILGLQVAILVHLLIVMGGLGAVIVASPPLYRGLRLCGALYLIWLGWQQWRQAGAEPPAAAGQGDKLFVQGVLVNLTNPKAILFMLALVPQFVSPAMPWWVQYGVFATTTCVIDTVVMSAYALLAGQLGRWRPARAGGTLRGRTFGALFILVGLLMLWDIPKN